MATVNPYSSLADFDREMQIVPGYAPGGPVEKFIPPELRQHTRAITAGVKGFMNAMKITDLKQFPKYQKMAIDGIKTGNVRAVSSAIAGYLTNFATLGLDVFPGGTQVKAGTKIAAKKIRDVAGKFTQTKPGHIKYGNQWVPEEHLESFMYTGPTGIKTRKWRYKEEFNPKGASEYVRLLNGEIIPRTDAIQKRTPKGKVYYVRLDTPKDKLNLGMEKYFKEFPNELEKVRKGEQGSQAKLRDYIKNTTGLERTRDYFSKLITAKYGRPPVKETETGALQAFREFRRKGGKSGLVEEDYLSTFVRSRPKELEGGVDQFIKVKGEIELNPNYEKYKEFGKAGKFVEFLDINKISAKNIKKMFGKEFDDFVKIEKKRVKLQDEINSDVIYNKAFKEMGITKGGSDVTGIVLQKAHLDHSIKRTGFSGADPENIRILGSTVNTVIQPNIEIKFWNAITKRNAKDAKRMLDMMKEFHIGTKMNHPNPKKKLKEADFQWLEKNGLIQRKIIHSDGVPVYTRIGKKSVPVYEEYVFGTTKQPTKNEIVQSELYAKRFNNTLKQLKKKNPKVKPWTYFDEGGEVQKFQDAGEVKKEGKSGIMDIDITPFIPPHMRFTEDLTPREIVEGAGEFSQEMAKYLTPGLGEYLSQQDYLRFSQSAEQARKEGKDLSAFGHQTIAAFALLGTIPNWSVVGAAPNVILGATKGVKKFAERVAKKKFLPAPAKMEKRYVVIDPEGKKFWETKSVDEANHQKAVLSDREGKPFTVEEVEVPVKVKKTQELVKVETVSPELVIGAGNNRLYYSKLDEMLTNPTGNINVRRTSGSTESIPFNDAALTAREWENTFRAAGIKESELGDSYIRQFINRRGGWDARTQKFTNNEKITYAEIKEMADSSPSRFLQTSKYSDADGNLKFADSGRAPNYKEGTREEHVLWIDSSDIRGDIGKMPDEVRGYEAHKDMRKVKTDVNFDANNKVVGEPYVVGWSLVDDRAGISANGKKLTVTTANEIQSDFLQKAASQKAKLTKELRTALQAGYPGKEIIAKIANIFRPMGKTPTEIQNLVKKIQDNDKILDKVAKMDLNLVDDAVMKQTENAVARNKVLLDDLVGAVDDIDPMKMFPNIPMKNQKDWVSSLIKNDLAIAAKKRFYFDENGVLQVNKNTPSHYSVSPSKVVKQRWHVPDEQYGMHIAANRRTTEQHGKGVAYDLEYGGPNVTDPNGKHFRGNVEETLRKVASDKNANFSIGKVQYGDNFEDSFLLELTPEMLTPYVQYFKIGGLVEKISQYTSLQSVLDVLGPIGAN